MTKDEALSLLDDLDEMEQLVTDWESDFLDSLLKQSDQENWRPSCAQVDVLNKMKEKYL